MNGQNVGNTPGTGDEGQECGDLEKGALEAFEKHQEAELVAFEKMEQAELEEFERSQHIKFLITIDRIEYVVRRRVLSGQQLRDLVSPPIPQNLDLFEIVPHGTDRKIEDGTEVTMCDGLRFFTAPAHINPGARL
jgi:hypothetical protein